MYRGNHAPVGRQSPATPPRHSQNDQERDAPHPPQTLPSASKTPAVFDVLGECCPFCLLGIAQAALPAAFFKALHPLQLQNTQFGFANFTGLAALLLFLMLLAISNDFSLRTLKTHRWKFLQRWTYAAFALTGAHGIAYQLTEKRHVLWVLVSSVTMIAVVAGQILGFFQFQGRMGPGKGDAVIER